MNRLLRIGLITACGAIAGALSAWSPSAKAEDLTLTVSIWDHGAPFQAPVIATQPDLMAMIPAKIKWVPINAAPPTLAAMKAGSFDIVSLVGNPPVVSAIANGTDLRVVWVNALDTTVLVVKPSITSPAQMAGGTFADVIGSSDDYVFRSWLKSQGLDKSVKVVEIASGEESVVTAFQTGAIDGAFVDAPQAIEMTAKGGKILITSDDTNKLGFMGVNVLVVRGQDVKDHPEAIQGFVCANLAASKLLLGPSADEVMRKAADITGQKPEDSVAAGHQVGWVAPQDQLAQLAGTTGNLADSPLVSNYVKTSQFLVELGRIPAPITADQVIKSIDPSFAQKALNGGCS
jgi:NitT/TauT family transport system substrate-binding protein